MAIVKPIVLDANLKLQQLQPGDTLGINADDQEATFTATVIAGAPIYADGNGTVDQARANADATSKVIGLAKAAVTAAATGFYTYDGVVTLTTGEWDAVAGTTGGLSVDLCYFLSDATAGRLLEEGATSGITGGDNRVLIGTAISTTEMQLNIQEPIKTA